MKQNEIWLINLNPTLGAEIKKTRPALIVNDDLLGKLPIKVIVPFTDWKPRYEEVPWMVKIVPDSNNNLSKVSSVDCFQIRSVSEERFVKKIGEVGSGISDSVKEALSKVLSIDI
jgi:mRNA interferase MazF